MISYAVRNETMTRLKAAVGGILPPGFLAALLAALLKAFGGGCIPPAAKAADVATAVANDTDGYLEEAIYTEFVARHGRLGARVYTARAVKALQDYAATLKPEDDDYVARFQSEALAQDPNA